MDSTTSFDTFFIYAVILVVMFAAAVAISLKLFCNHVHR